MDHLISHYLAIGKKVTKSGKPFKSGRKINTVRGIALHPKKKTPAFIFEEDDSVVECSICKLVEPERTNIVADGFTVSLFPPGHDYYRDCSVSVASRGKGMWAVVCFASVLSRKGKWVYEPMPSSRTPAWVKNHRFGLQEAIELARKHAGTMEINGRSVEEILRMVVEGKG